MKSCRSGTAGVGPPGVLMIACISAISRSCATAKGPNCSSKPITRFDAASIAPRTAPAPWSSATVVAIRRSTPSRKVPVPTAGSATVTSVEARPSVRSNKGPRRASSTSRTIAPTTSGGV